jgi:hypothetical protein
MSSPRERIFRELAVLLGGEAAGAGRMHLRARLGKTELRISGPVPATAPEEQDGHAACGAPMPPPNPLWKWLSPEEDALLRGATDQYQTAEKLAELAGLPLSGETKAILRNMVGRNILESSQGKGYRRTPMPVA